MRAKHRLQPQLAAASDPADAVIHGIFTACGNADLPYHLYRQQAYSPQPKPQRGLSAARHGAFPPRAVVLQGVRREQQRQPQAQRNRQQSGSQHRQLPPRQNIPGGGRQNTQSVIHNTARRHMFTGTGMTCKTASRISSAERLCASPRERSSRRWDSTGRTRCRTSSGST